MTIAIAVAAALLGGGIGFLVALRLARKDSSERIRELRSDQERLLQEAAQRAQKEAEAQLQKELRVARDKLEEDNREERRNNEQWGKRLDHKEEKLIGREEDLAQREKDWRGKEQSQRDRAVNLDRRTSELDTRSAEIENKLVDVAGMSRDEARQELIAAVEKEAQTDVARRLKAFDELLKEEEEKRATKVVATALQRYAGEYVSEKTVSVVALPNDEMKGRIIGREGRNIRALEAATGIDLIIDDTPDVVILSGFNPIRREIARHALEALIRDGRIHPSRIEELVHKAEKEFNKKVKAAGEQACYEAAVHGVHAEEVKLIGALKWRTSYGQNQWQHALEVSHLAGMMAAEIGLDQKIAKRAGLLHDIGKVLDQTAEGSHALIGAEFAKKHGEKPIIVNAIASHHEEVPQTTLYAPLVQAADTISGARPGARREVLESYLQRLNDLEQIGNSFPGVDKTYAIQAGREVRVIVSNGRVRDEDAVLLSRDIAKKIEEELSYPGQIKVTVIRETRAIEYAR
jgi:ribonucrease Y